MGLRVGNAIQFNNPNPNCDRLSSMTLLMTLAANARFQNQTVLLQGSRLYSPDTPVTREDRTSKDKTEDLRGRCLLT